MPGMLRIQLFSFVLLVLCAACVQADEKLWGLLRSGGHVVFMRHAITTPGVGDPAGFRVEDCATQRNLTAEGRETARRIGEVFRARGIRLGEVLSSRWCRCTETAQLAFGRYQLWPELNSLYQDPAARDKQTQAVRRRVAAHRGPDNLILVSHGANILPLTGIHPSPGGMVILTPGGRDGFRVAGTMEPEDILTPAKR
jgi:phosphohistidine phosphatase SixA